MARFKAAVLTQKGSALLAKAAAGMTGIEFTRAMTGDGSYDGTEDLEAMTALKDAKQTFGITSKEIVDENALSLKVIVNNTGLAEGYYVKEYGIFATDPDEGEILYSISIAFEDQWDYLPAYSNESPSTITVTSYARISNDIEVTIRANMGVYASADDVNQMRDNMDSMITKSGNSPNRNTNIRSEGTGKVQINGINLIDLVYPIGSIYTSSADASPELIFGGTWERIKDTFLLTAGDNYQAGDTGGEANHTLTTAELATHSHAWTGNTSNESANHTHGGSAAAVDINHFHSGNTGDVTYDHVHGGSTSTNGNHNHGVYVQKAVTNGSGYYRVENATGGTWPTTYSGDHAHSFTTGGISRNHQHYFNSGYMSSNNAHGHSTTSGTQSHPHNHPVTGTNQNSGSGTAHNNMPPYKVVYAWERVA